MNSAIPFRWKDDLKFTVLSTVPIHLNKRKVWCLSFSECEDPNGKKFIRLQKWQKRKGDKGSFFWKPKVGFSVKSISQWTAIRDNLEKVYAGEVDTEELEKKFFANVEQTRLAQSTNLVESSKNIAVDARLKVKEVNLQLKERKLREERANFEKEKLEAELSNYSEWKKEIVEFENLLNSFTEKRLKEKDIQQFLENKRWAFGLEYTIHKPQKKIGSRGIADFYLMRSDGNMDFVELKKPSESIFDKNKKLTPVVGKAMSQIVNYIETAINISGNERLKTIEQINAVKPKGFIIIGRDGDANEQRELEIFNSYFHGFEIWTYDKLLKKVKTSIDSIKKKRKVVRRRASKRAADN